jgi:hypothetical protein
LSCQSELNPVRASISISQKGDRAADISSSSLAEEDRFGAVLIPNLFESLFDRIKRLLPRNSGPFPFPSLSCTLHGIEESIRMIDILGQGQNPGAKSSLVPGMILIALYFDQSSVLDMELDTASTMAARSRRPDRRSNNLFFLFAHRALLLQKRINLIVT